MTLEQTLQQIQKSKFWRDRKVLILFCLGLILNLFTWVYILRTLHGAKEPIPLHYNILSGVDLVGVWHKLLAVPLIGLGVLIINSVLVFYFYVQRRKDLVNLLLGTLLVCQLILLVSTLLIVNL